MPTSEPFRLKWISRADVHAMNVQLAPMTVDALDVTDGSNNVLGFSSTEIIQHF
jgi:hypothetical protein